MAFDKAVDSAVLDANLKTVADAIREKAGTSDSLVFPTGFAEAIAGIQAGGGSDEEWFNDGDTHIWITLPEGRTSPMLGVGVNGTVTVDWGDGSTPDVLTGTSEGTTKKTPVHNYARPGNYVITLTADGAIGLSGGSGGSRLLQISGVTGDPAQVYRNAVRRIECGSAVTRVSDYAFHRLQALSSIVIPESITSIGSNAFNGCYLLSSIDIPDGVTSIGESTFSGCRALSSIVIPNGVTSIGNSAFAYCESLASMIIPKGVVSIGSYAFDSCYSLLSIDIPDSVTSIGDSAFAYCESLASVVIPDGVTSISGVFENCKAIASVIIPKSVTSIGAYTFYSGCGAAYYDFSNHTAVPSLANANAFSSIRPDCEIRVPADLYDEWIAATNWSTLASNIVAV